MKTLHKTGLLLIFLSVLSNYAISQEELQKRFSFYQRLQITAGIATGVAGVLTGAFAAEYLQLLPNPSAEDVPTGYVQLVPFLALLPIAAYVKVSKSTKSAYEKLIDDQARKKAQKYAEWQARSQQMRIHQKYTPGIRVIKAAPKPDLH